MGVSTILFLALFGLSQLLPSLEESNSQAGTVQKGNIFQSTPSSPDSNNQTLPPPFDSGFLIDDETFRDSHCLSDRGIQNFLEGQPTVLDGYRTKSVGPSRKPLSKFLFDLAQSDNICSKVTLTLLQIETGLLTKSDNISEIELSMAMNCLSNSTSSRSLENQIECVHDRLNKKNIQDDYGNVIAGTIAKNKATHVLYTWLGSREKGKQFWEQYHIYWGGNSPLP